MNRRTWVRTLGRVAATAATAGCAAGAGLSVGLAVDSTPAAAAVNAGSARIVNPTTGAALASGGSATEFQVKLPDFSACTGDSADKGYRVQSYVVPQSVALDTLRFDSDGPVKATGQFRGPFFAVDETPYVNVNTASAIPAGGPGPIIQPLPTFDFSVYNTSSFPFAPGVYNVGVACTLGNETSATQLDKYWNNVLTVTSDPADPGPAKIKFAVTAAAPSTTTTLAMSPATGAPQGTEVTLTATVAPAAAVGSVQFKDGTAAVGAAVPVTNGTATLKKSDLTAGAHSFTASFVPTTAAAFAPSVSAAAAYTISAATGATTTTAVGSSTSTTLSSSSSSSSSTTSTTRSGASATEFGAGSGTGSGSRASTGATAASTGRVSELPKTGGSFLPVVVWSFFLVCFGRVAVLLGRRPSGLTSKR